MSELLQTLQAGGLVPATAKLPKDAHVDPVVARAYGHAVLPGRKVVRLSAENVVTGDDLEMATLGFGPGEDRGVVGKERKRPLGFPGWALVHDPVNARLALGVVKELKKQARKAKSKPGHAKEGLDAIADQLGRSVPHFLPAFYEECGRVFIEHGALAYAAAMFGKARDAEAVHALEVDEQHRVDAFLEFALAGAVTTKALTQYAKQLAEHHEPAVAYRHFRQLCLQRTLGGLPPWSGMAKELRRLAKAAKLEPDAEDAAFVAEIIESPALAKAAGEFWHAYAAPLTALGKQSAAARGALLNLFPTGTKYSRELDDAWLALLEATGATAALVGDDVALEATTSAGRAAWFDKLTQHLARDWQHQQIGVQAFALLRRIAPMLIADGKPITALGRANRIGLDLAELALELGVPVAPPPEVYLDLDRWAKHAGEPERGRDPVRVAAHPVLGPLLASYTSRTIGNEPFDTVSRGMHGFLAAKRAWLEATITELEQGALVGIEEGLAQLARRAKPTTFAELPDLYTRFAAFDLAPALARTLRIGIIDELGWPLLEEVVAELDPDGKAELTAHGGPPALVLATRTRAVAIAATGRLGTHDLVVPPKHELVTVRFIGGQFLVVLKQAQQLRAYWSAAPFDVFDSELSSWQVPPLATIAAVLPDGAWIESAVPMRAGDRKISLGASIVAFDGTTSWVQEWKDGQSRWREKSAHGEAGRHSYPAWIEAAIDGTWRIASSSRLMPAPGVTSSPLGVADGFVGARIRYEGPHQNRPTRRELEMIDGTRWVGPPDVLASWLIRIPAAAEPRPLVDGHDHANGTTITILSSDGAVRGSRFATKDRTYARGQAMVWPPDFWHPMTARDEVGSRKLRAISDDEARELLAAVPVATTPPAGIVHPEPANFTLAVLPEVTHPRLVSGLAGICVRAAALQLERDRIATERAPTGAPRRTVVGPDDATLTAALGGWIERAWSQNGMSWAQIERAGELFASGDRTDRTVLAVPPSAVDWLTFAVSRWSLAMLAAAHGLSLGHRTALVRLLQHLVTQLPAVATLRVFTAAGTLELPDADALYAVRWHAARAYAIKRLGYGTKSVVRVLEYAPDGVFAPLPGLTISRETRGVTGPAPDEVSTLVTAIAAGQTSWSAEAAGRLHRATGLTASEATFLWAGAPNANDRGTNFLPKELREHLGLRATQAAIARDGLATVPLAKRIAALDEAGRAGVAAILDGSAADALATAWLRLVGKRVAIPEQLVDDAGDVYAPIAPSLALAMIGNAAEAPELACDGNFAFDPLGALRRTGQPTPLVGQPVLANADPVFDGATLQTVAVYIPFLFASLPVGHPLRMQAVTAYDLVLARLRNPALWLDAGRTYLEPERAATLDRLLDGLGGELVAGLDESSTLRLLPGCAVVRVGPRVELKLQPATLDAKAMPIARNLALQLPTSSGIPMWKALELVRSVDFVALLARIGKTIVPEGGWEQNALASVPKLVDKVAAARKLSREAAALYLMYLTLLWPTSKNVQRWTGWKPAQLEAANEELVARELVLEAKRERAGRGHFLPGGWEALKSPHPPLEHWKIPLYGVRDARGELLPPFQRYQALAPFHLLFERAWQRIETGDVPRFEEIKKR
ncbi:MAG: hypothetical protein WKG01_23170 [Kofleriaceae bacterium]